MTEKTAVMICGQSHGSETASGEFDALTQQLRARLSGFDVGHGVLDGAGLSVRDGLEVLRSKGAETIICLPASLDLAGPLKSRLPTEISGFAADHPGAKIELARELAIDARLLAAARDRIKAAEAAAGSEVAREASVLMVVGAGGDDTDANSNVWKMTRMLWEGMGFAWAEVSYAETAFPPVGTGLEHAAALGYKRIIIFPYFLFGGDWRGVIDAAAVAGRAAHPDIEIIQAGHLNDPAALVESFAARVDEALGGSKNMNCQLCTYREQVVAHEHDHPHDHGHAHDHKHDHAHDHHHHHDDDA